MSHSPETHVCPNCGFETTHNYCAQCGQETHLHNETFWGMVMHFIGHYFHYDSKFWQTMKALWFSPGKLTIAYMNKQRMRYIPPISLYIFISAVYFLLNFSSGENNKLGDLTINDSKKAKTEKNTVIVNNVHTLRNVLDSLDNDTTSTPKGSFESFMNSKAEKIKTEHGDTGKYIKECIIHSFPKIFFFMIPLMAIMLKFLFARRKNILFVDHAIFSLHYHSFWFSLFALALFPLPTIVQAILYFLLSVVAAVYMFIALRRVYNIKKIRAFVTLVALFFAYVIFFTAALVTMFFLAVALA